MMSLLLIIIALLLYFIRHIMTSHIGFYNKHTLNRDLFCKLMPSNLMTPEKECIPIITLLISEAT